MIKRFLFLSLFLAITNLAFAAEDKYFPSYDDHRYRLGNFWGSVTFGSYIPLGTLSDGIDVTSGVGLGFSFLDIFGIEVRGAFQRYDKTSMILAKSGLIPSDSPGNEIMNKFDITAYAIVQPSFKVAKGVEIAPYVGVGGDFSLVQYSYTRTTPNFAYESTMNMFGFAAKGGIRFRFSNMLIGAGVEYIYAIPSDFYGLDFSSLTYQLELGFII